MGTIELLETVGRDASLRRASAHDLAQALDGMGASEGLKLAVATGDQTTLKREFGSRLNQNVRVNDNPHNGGCDPGGDDDVSEEAPDRDDDERAKEEPDGS